MKYFIRNFGVFVIGLGVTLSVFEFLLENSGIVFDFWNNYICCFLLY
tara:strand:- start:383 stop:523 length:141 start_codon:yes stop_codon:yes gene_type:complete